MSGKAVVFNMSPLQAAVGERVSWRDRAACSELDYSMFFPDKGDVLGNERAKQVCAACPVKGDCLSYAVGTNQTEGIWGGTTQGERRRLRRLWLKELREAG